MGLAAIQWSSASYAVVINIWIATVQIGVVILDILLESNLRERENGVRSMNWTTTLVWRQESLVRWRQSQGVLSGWTVSAFMAAVPGTSPGLTRKEEQCLEDRLRSASLEHVLDPQRWRIGLAQDLGPSLSIREIPLTRARLPSAATMFPSLRTTIEVSISKSNSTTDNHPAATPSRTSPSFETTGCQSHLWNLRVWIATWLLRCIKMPLTVLVNVWDKSVSQSSVKGGLLTDWLISLILITSTDWLSLYDL
jgi:hypothetical protein